MNIQENKMTNQEIRDKIIFNRKKIKELLDPSIFILQPEVSKLIEEIEELQTQCSHDFVGGVCIYCDIAAK